MQTPNLNNPGGLPPGSLDGDVPDDPYAVSGTKPGDDA